MATYKVQTGDTVSAIAKRFGVTPKEVSGFRSNDPNVILPGEELTISTPAQPTTPDPVVSSGALVPQTTPTGAPAAPAPTPSPIQVQGGALVPQSGPAQVVSSPVAPQTPTAPTQSQIQAPNAPVAPVQPQSPTLPTPALQPTVSAPAAPSQPIPTIEESLQNITDLNPELGAQLESLLVSSAETSPEEDPAQNFFGQFGVNPGALESGFSTNPAGTISDLVRQVMETIGLPDVRDNITKISGEIEELENERDAEIAEINDNPWTSAGSKAELIEKITEKYEKKISNRTNRLTLLQSSYEDARDEARFATTTAINLYDKERNFRQDQIDSYLDRAERASEARRKGDNEAFDRAIRLRELNIKERAQLLDETTTGGGAFASDPTQALAYAQQYAATGMIPTGLPKGSFGVVSNLAKSLPHQEGAIVSSITGVKDSKVPATEQEDLGRLYNIVKMTDQLKELDEKRWGGVVSGLVGKTFGSNAQGEYLTVRKAITDEITRMQTGAALTVDEQAFYGDYLPGRFSEPFTLGQDSTKKIENFKKIMEGKLLNASKNRSLSIVGYSTVKLGGKDYKVGDTIEINGVQGRVLPTGEIVTVPTE